MNSNPVDNEADVQQEVSRRTSELVDDSSLEDSFDDVNGGEKRSADDGDESSEDEDDESSEEDDDESSEEDDDEDSSQDDDDDSSSQEDKDGQNSNDGGDKMLQSSSNVIEV